MTHKTIKLEPDWGVDFGQSPQLEIRHIEDRKGRLYILGVSHSAIKIGDKLKTLQCFPTYANPQDVIGIDLMTLNLRVISITAYYRQLNRINAGMTVGIELEGNWSNLFSVLCEHGWTMDNNKSHQWCDNLLKTEKLILTR